MFSNVYCICLNLYYSMHYNYNNFIFSDVPSTDVHDCMKHILKNRFIASQNLSVKYVENLGIEMKEFYEKNVVLLPEDIVKLAWSTRGQDSEQWIKERQKRITGSVCYTLYTYSRNKSPDWHKKLNALYSANFGGNYATEYGNEMEKRAREAYSHITGYKVVTPGLIVDKDESWLAFSPDGVVSSNENLRLIEIKCPLIGKSMPASDFVPQLSYITKDNKLKQKHQYYGQIQLGLALIGASICDLIIYSSYDDSFITISVPFDEKFVSKMLTNLAFVYFNYILPFLLKIK